VMHTAAKRITTLTAPPELCIILPGHTQLKKANKIIKLNTDFSTYLGEGGTRS
jgi:hypothetical protein